MKNKLYFLSQFSNSQGSGVGDYCFLLGEKLNLEYGIRSEIRSWSFSNPNWPTLLTPPSEKGILSLQFVPYSYGRRGLFFEFLKSLKKFQTSWDIHIMFHEIWIGYYPKAPIKHQLVGKIQKYLIKKLVNLPNVKIVQTSNEAYLSELSKICSVQYLPLFGNIHFSTDYTNINNDLSKIIQLKEKSKRPMFSFFGSIYENIEILERIKEIIDSFLDTSFNPIFISIGTLRSGSTFWNKIQKEFSHSANFIEIGEVSEEEVSIALQNSDFGLTTCNLEIIGKSGATMSMLEHGLPVILSETTSSKNLTLNKFYLDQLVFPETLKTELEKFKKNGHSIKKSPRSGIKETAKIFRESIIDYL